MHHKLPVPSHEKTGEKSRFTPGRMTPIPSHSVLVVVVFFADNCPITVKSIVQITACQPSSWIKNPNVVFCYILNWKPFMHSVAQIKISCKSSMLTSHVFYLIFLTFTLYRYIFSKTEFRSFLAQVHMRPKAHPVCLKSATFRCYSECTQINVESYRFERCIRLLLSVWPRMTEILRASERTGACPAANALPHKHFNSAHFL